MRGRPFHNLWLVDKPARALERLGANVSCEYPITPGLRPCYMDCYAEYGLYRIGIEGENSARRIQNGVAKADELKLHLLFFITPNCRVSRAVTHRLLKLKRTSRRQWQRILVMTLAAALELLGNRSRFEALLNDIETSGQGHNADPPNPSTKPKHHKKIPLCKFTTLE